MCDKLEKRIQLHQAALDKLKTPSTGINADQVPKLQLKHLKSHFFKNCPTFAAIEAFITQFEYFVDFACIDITTDWKRLIPMAFLLKCITGSKLIYFVRYLLGMKL